MAEIEKLIGSESPLEVGQKINEIIENGTGIDPETLEQIVTKDSLQEVQVVIETYKNGTSWYRIWSDGWCEQGGYASSNPSTVTFLKTFVDTNYYMNCSNNANSADVGAWIGDRTASSAKINNAVGGAYWQACGYLW